MHDEYTFHCNHCGRTRLHQRVNEAYEIGDNDEAERWEIVRCSRCNSPAFLKTFSQQSNDTLEVTASDVYPLREYKRPKDFPHLPDRLEQIYRETIDAYNNDSRLFCAGGLRSLIEGICVDKGIGDGPVIDPATGVASTRPDGTVNRGTKLVHKIEGLAERRLLLESQARLLHEHRFLGNDALHELDRPSRAVLDVAIDIIEVILSNLYMLEAQANQLRQLRYPDTA